MADKATDVVTDETSEGGKKKLIIIIAAVVVLLLAGGGAAAYFLLLKKPPPEESEEQKQAAQVELPASEEQEEFGPTVDIEEFIVNIISDDTNHYVKASLTLELNKEEAMEEATKRMPQIRDTILMLIGNKTFEELQDLQGKKQLKAELKSKINSFLRTGKVKNIYLTGFVVQ